MSGSLLEWLGRMGRGLRTLPAPSWTDLGYRLAAILLAVLLWSWVQESQELETTQMAQVLYAWPESLVLSQPVPERVRVTVKGSRSALRRLQQNNLRLSVDLRDAGAGVQTIDFLGRELLGLPAGLTVSGLVPSALEVTLEKRLRRKVPLVAVTSGEVALGHQVSTIRLKPEAITVEGPESLVLALESVSTAQIALDGIKDTTTVQVEAALSAIGLQRTDDTPISATVQVEPVVESRIYENVEVVVKTEGWRTDVESLRVTLRGPWDLLQEVTDGDLTVLLVADKPDARRGDLTLRWPSRGANRVEVLHPGGKKVLVEAVEPPEVTLRREGLGEARKPAP